MLTATLFAILFVVCPLQINAQGVNVTETLLRSQTVIDTVRLTLDEKLPPNQEARENGNLLLESVQLALKNCDEKLKKDLLVPSYIECVNETKVYAMVSVGELAGQSWAKSGASRPGLFC